MSIDEPLQADAERAKQQGLDAAHEKLPGRNSHYWRYVAAGGLIAALIVAASLMLLAHIANTANHKADTAVKKADSAEAGQQANAAALGDANSQIRSLGGTPVATPSPAASGPQGPRGDTGAEPSAAQVQARVTAYCAAHQDCKGTPSRTQVAAAVTAYCAATTCRGPSGVSGSPGSDGKNGADGAAGPGPTDDQIASAVAAYCGAHGGCTGPAGPKGDTGEQGPAGPSGPSGASGSNGRGIASIDCTGLGVDQLQITYSDGTTQTVPCNAQPVASPTS